MGVFDLWLAIIASAVVVFVVSSILHMLIPIHKNDYRKMPNEAELMKAMRESGLKQGQYMFPCADSMKEMGTPEMIAKFEEGPVGHVTVLPDGPPAMGKSLVELTRFSGHLKI